MKFVEAFRAMKNGAMVKLPSWGGYWYWDEEKQTIMMHTKEDKVLDIRETDRVEYTLGNVISDEWIIADEVNTPVLGGEATFSFGEAIKYLKRGFKVARKGWNGKNQYLFHVRPYDNEYYDVIEKNIQGTLNDYIAIQTCENTVVPWLASQTDMLAEDWVFVD